MKEALPRLKLIWGDSHYGGTFRTWARVILGWEIQTVKALTIPKRGLLVPEGEDVDWDKLFPSGFRPLPRRWVIEITQSQDPRDTSVDRTNTTSYAWYEWAAQLAELG